VRKIRLSARKIRLMVNGHRPGAGRHLFERSTHLTGAPEPLNKKSTDLTGAPAPLNK